MKTEDKQKLLALGQQLSTTGVEFRIAQLGLEKAVEQHGMSSPEAGEASALCSDLALRFSRLEEEFLALKDRIQRS